MCVTDLEKGFMKLLPAEQKLVIREGTNLVTVFFGEAEDDLPPLLGGVCGIENLPDKTQG